MTLEVYVTNLGRYNEGHLDGAYLKLPAEKADVQALLKKIHVDGVRYEEIFITDYETDIPGLRGCLGEYESIDELNYLASLLDELSEGEMEKFAAAVEMGDYASSVKDLINLSQNLDCYDFTPGIEDENDLGRYYIEELGALDVPGHLRQYIDYEAYGRDVSMEESSCFAKGGYIRLESSGFEEIYNGRDIPAECRIFAYPEPEKLSIRETLQQYQRMVDSAPARARPAPAHEER